MSAYLRIIAALFAFVIGVSAVYAASEFTSGFTVLGFPYGRGEVLEVAAPRVPDPPSMRTKTRHGEHRHCRRDRHQLSY
jgi:hypothetical protein